MFEFLKSLVGSGFQKPGWLSSMFVPLVLKAFTSCQVATQTTTEGLNQPLFFYSSTAAFESSESLVLTNGCVGAIPT